MARQRIGNRRHSALAELHNGNKDEHGIPTYETLTDWDTVISAWPCERITTSGAENIRGRQTDAEATHVFFGEYFGGRGITPQMRLVVDGNTYNVVFADDQDGDAREMRVETKVTR